MIKRTLLTAVPALAAAMAVGMALATPPVAQALPAASPGPTQASTPHAFCWGTNDPAGHLARKTYYVSRIFPIGADMSTGAFLPQWRSVVSGLSDRPDFQYICEAKYTRQIAETVLNDRVARYRRDGHEVVFTDWSPR